MPKIHFVKERETIEVEKGSNLMQSLLEKGVPVASSCKGQTVCAKCVVEVVKNSYNLSVAGQEERDVMDIKGIAANHRLSCSCTVEDDVTIDTPYW